MISPIESDNDDDADDSIIASDTYWDRYRESNSTPTDSFSEEDDYSIDSVEYSAILEEDYENYYAEKEDKKYYLGSCAMESGYNEESRRWILAGTISPIVFFRHRAIDVAQFLWVSSMFYRFHGPKIDILQLHISAEGVHYVIIKTFWLRLVQRTWRRVCRERREMWKKRLTMGSLRTREITGKYPIGLRNLPVIAIRVFA